MKLKTIRLCFFVLMGFTAACSASNEAAVEDVVIELSTVTAIVEPTLTPTASALPTRTPPPTATPEPTQAPTATLPPTATLLSPSELHTIKELADFQNLFNQKSETPRLILFMATGCPSCLIAGEWIDSQVLEPNPELDIEVFVIWLITADGGGRWQEGVLDDPRVLHFYGPKRAVVGPFAGLSIDGPERSSLARTYGQLSWGENAIWDAYFYFDAGTMWEENAPPDPQRAAQPLMTERHTIEALLTTDPIESATTLDTTSPIEFEIVAEQSAVSYGVGETFAGQAFNYAIGVTNVMSGGLQIDFNNLAASTISTITINIREFQSDNILRDERIRSAHLVSNSFPLALFTPKELVGLPANYTLGETVQFGIDGDLVVREISVPITFQVEASIVGDRLIGTATSQVLMTDFGFDPPIIANLITTENEVDIVFEFVAEAVSE